MPLRLIAPTVGLVLALVGCGGGGSSPVPVPAPVPVPIPPPAPPPVTTANSIERVKAAMVGAHDAQSAELTSGPFVNGPAVTAAAAAAPVGAVALGGFGQVYVAQGHASTNTRVQLRNLETYVLAKSSGVWKRVQYSEKVVGALFAANYTGASSGASVRAESSGGVSFQPTIGRLFRFWPESGVTRSLVVPSDIDAVFTTVQARLIKDVETGPDDRSAARLLVDTGADWWNSVVASSSPSFASTIPSNAVLGNGKLNLALSDWRAMNFHSATSVQVDALATPLTGGTAPIANSTPLDAAATTRIMLIGDSITQGNAVQDSYRRDLWNRLVSDPRNLQIDFVGTRNGTTVSGGTCTSAAADATGGYRVAEFDDDHQAYWGWCIDDVTGALPNALSTLAAAAVMNRPDIALIHLGTNDLFQQGQSGVAAASDLETQVATLRTANSSIRLLLSKIILIDSGRVPSQTLADYNAAVSALGTTLSQPNSPVTIVDQFTGFIGSSAPGGDRYDDFHPNDSGEAKMAAKALTALKQAIP